MMKNIFLALLSIWFLPEANAATVDTVNIPSKAMNNTFKCVVIKPMGNSPATGWPVVYLLHGYSGNYSSWIMKVPDLKEYADKFGMMIVCPDGNYSSWYLDSPIDPKMKFETYVAIEVPDFIDQHYKTRKNRQGRAITGLSMGGHGGIYLGFRHADRFGAIGSMSGGVDLNSSRAKYDIIKRIGDTITHAGNWKNYSVITIVEKYPADSVRIIIDCGTEDFFYQDNQALHKKLLALKIPHDYIERPGKHDWIYWANAVGYQLLFFKDYFDDMSNGRK